MTTLPSTRERFSGHTRLVVKLKAVMRGIPGVMGVYTSILPRLPATGAKGFHGDVIYQGLIKEIASSMPITSFIETGTFLGDSTSFVASERKDLPIWTCEISEEFHVKAKRRLKRFRHVQVVLSSSEKFVAERLDDGRIGDLPFFFLDAHWYDYWPLEDEIDLISTSHVSCIMVIDDFKVSNNADFGFDVSVGKIADQQNVCGIELILPKLGKTNQHRFLVPCYSKEDIIHEGGTCLDMRGHIVIFQNLDNEFEAFNKRDFIRRYYRELQSASGAT